ncbi:MAG: phage terminase small subunit P27 family [Zhenhengia sp.]|uniref:phage terminase small subunit P27 family n=1 Tax=Zhenhengia sp. TaxID=2944208 RepID=UPI003990EA62
MARPTKSITTRTGHMSKTDIDRRLEYEAKLRGDSDKIRAPAYLTLQQKKHFRTIVDYLKESGILGNIDVYLLAQTAITIDRIQACEVAINQDGVVDLEGNPNPHIKIRTAYMKDFFRMCNELSLSPQARAKIANINCSAEAEKTDPLLTILGGGKK